MIRIWEKFRFHLLEWSRFYLLILTLSTIASLLVASTNWINEREVERITLNATAKGFQDASPAIFANAEIFDFQAVIKICEALILRPAVAGVKVSLVNQQGAVKADICHLPGADFEFDPSSMKKVTERKQSRLDNLVSEATLFIATSRELDLINKSLIRGAWAFLFITILLVTFGLIFVRVFIYPGLRELMSTMRRRESIDRSKNIGTANHFLGRVIDQFDSMQNDLERENQEKQAVLNRLFDSERQLRTTLDSIEHAIFTTDRDGRLLLQNSISEKLIERLVGTPFNTVQEGIYSVFPEAQIELTSIEAIDSLKGLISKSRQVKLRDGTVCWFNLTIAPFLSNSGEINGLVFLIRDVTEEIVTQRMLLHSEKMQAVGELAAGIAHDFNNILSAISSATEMVQLSNANDENSDRLLNIILRSCDRANQLVERLLVFSSDNEIKLSKLNAAEMVKDTIEILQATQKHQISIDMQPDVRTLKVLGNTTALQNVLMNLCINSFKAMPEGGEVYVSLRLLEDSATPPTGVEVILEQGPGDYVAVEVCDNGIGIPVENLRKIFVPFFTTRRNSGGTGLGLAMVYSTMKVHAGGLWIKSSHGVGTQITLLLPLNGSYKEEKAKIHALSLLPRVF